MHTQNAASSSSAPPRPSVHDPQSISNTLPYSDGMGSLAPVQAERSSKTSPVSNVPVRKDFLLRGARRGHNMAFFMKAKQRLKKSGQDTSDIDAKIEALAEEKGIPVPGSITMYYYHVHKKMAEAKRLSERAHAAANPGLISPSANQRKDPPVSPRTLQNAELPFRDLYDMLQYAATAEERGIAQKALEAKARSEGRTRAPPNYKAWVVYVRKEGKEPAGFRRTSSKNVQEDRHHGADQREKKGDRCWSGHFGRRRQDHGFGQRARVQLAAVVDTPGIREDDKEQELQGLLDAHPAHPSSSAVNPTTSSSSTPKVLMDIADADLYRLRVVAAVKGGGCQPY